MRIVGRTSLVALLGVLLPVVSAACTAASPVRTAAAERSVAAVPDDGLVPHPDPGFLPVPRGGVLPHPHLDFVAAPGDGASWAPAPVDVGGGVTAVAGTVGDEYRLHTADGDVTFLPGVNLGATTPGHLPGELAVDAATYGRWFALMGSMGIRVVRVYTIHPPAFYTALRAYNLAHPDAPVYLMAGVWLPDASYETTQDLYAAGPTAAFDAEITAAVAAVHGDLTRPDTPGLPGGTWTADVSPWTAGWIAGVEWDPVATSASDARNAGAPAFLGRYFAGSADATPTERWLAARLETLATALTARKAVAPVAFVNWSVTDPLRHPDEPRPTSDLEQLDPGHVRPTAEWRGGYFASYHAYPYYPEFLRHEPGLRGADGTGDPYAGYLRALKRHHAGLPVMIAEFGVPSSLGSSHKGTDGRDQGGHSEQEAIAMDAAMLRTIHDLGLAGGLLFSWTDEWWKPVWNTADRQVPADRRQLWHDPLSSEQWYGLLAQDPVPSADAGPSRLAGAGAELVVTADPGRLTLQLTLARPPAGPVTLGFDVVPGGAGVLPDGTADAASDYAVTLDPAAGTGQVRVRRALDPVLLDFEAGELPGRGTGPWVPAQLTMNRALTVPTTGQQLPAELFDVGALRAGPMEPGAAGYDSRNTFSGSGGSLTVRLPWALLGVADPSSRRALLPGGPGRPAATVPVDAIGVTLLADGAVVPLGGFSWSGWDRVRSAERVKAGAQAWVDAVAAVSTR